MPMDNLGKPAEELAESAKKYIELKIDSIKLKSAENLSVTLARIFGMITMLMIGMTALTAASFGVILILGEAVGSYAAGAFIVAGIFALVLAILFILRKKLYLNSFVRLFIKLFFDENDRIQ